MGDVKAYLRKMDFPDVVPEALSHMQKLWLPDCTSQQLSLMKELSQEFVFFEIDQWGHVREQKLNPIKELQVLERISWYFKEPGTEQKLATFIFLFPFGSKMLDKRLPILGKLASLGIGIGNGNVLTYIGAWMQLAGCASQYSLYLAKSIQQERLRVNCYSSNIVKNLPNNSQLFCASLVAALANMYVLKSPPNHIVEVVLNWMKMKPLFCFESLNLNVPKTFNFSGPQTPIPEVMHWTILSPLTVKKSEPNKNEESDSLFSALHLAILECMLQGSKLKNITKWESVPTDRIIIIVEALKATETSTQETMAISLERLAQCLEVGLANKCIHPKSGKLGELFVCCLNLPYHQLLKIVLQKWSYELEAGKKMVQPECKVTSSS